MGDIIMNERNIRLTGVKPTSVGLFVGTLGALFGLVVAIAAWISSTIGYTNSTNSLLQGLLLGFGAGVLTLFIAPAIYFAVGWVIGWVDGFFIDWALSSMGGIAVGTRVEEPLTAEAGQVAGRPATTFGETIDSTRRK
jgi:nitroreductase